MTDDKLPENVSQGASEPLHAVVAKNFIQDASIIDADLKFVTDYKEAALRRQSPIASAMLITISIFLVLALTWAHFAILDEVTSAEGHVIPPSQIKVIQDIDGGVVERIEVKEGESVKAGQILMRMDATRPKAQYQQELAENLALVANVARLTAEVNNEKSINFPAILDEHQELKDREAKLFETRRQELNDILATLRRSYKLAKKELDMSVPMVNQGVMSKIELYRVQRQVNELEGEISDRLNRFQSDAGDQLNKQKALLLASNASLNNLQDRVKHTTIVSPVDGTVKQINVMTVGGVVQPGMNIMEIVPDENYLLIQAKVKPQDIAFIKIGQQAKVKFSAYDFSIFGGLDGKVEYISADTLIDEKDKDIYYEVLVRTEKNYLGNHENSLPIKVGMVTSVDIITGRKSVLDYLLKPIMKVKQKALRER